jgi:putative FmdB family regulatory protein
MPTYDYVCEACEHAFEHFQSMTSRRLRKCPACGKPKLERLIGSGSGVIFKGSGFYETDYKRSGSAGKSKDAGEVSSPSETSSPAKETSTSSDGGTSSKSSKD